MPRGGRRPGSGRRAKSLAELDLTGGIRPTRHAHLLKPVFPASVEAWTPDPALLAGQGAAGRAFIERMTAANDFTMAEGELVLELGHVMSRLAAVRAEPRAGRDLKAAAMLERLELGWSRQFGSLMAQLRVTT
jgi:hypothetical protein